MNLSYNSLPECLNLKISEQLINLSELFNPLVTRAKLYSNPLFRQDVINNDKIKKWGQDVLRKTRAFGSLLTTPAEVDAPSIDAVQEESSLSQSEGSRKGGKNFLSRLFKSKKKEVSPESAQPAVPHYSTHTEEDDLLTEYAINRRNSEKVGPIVRHVDHQLYRSYSDDFNNSLHSNDFPSHSTLTSGSEESESRVWLNVNSSGSSHSHAVSTYSNARRNASHSRSYVSPPPAQPSSPQNSVISDSEERSPEEGEFVSLDSTDGVQQMEVIDFDSILQPSPPSGFYESRGTQIDPSTLAAANLIGRREGVE